MFCKNCGSKLNDGDSFCTNCGQDLRNNQNNENNFQHEENRILNNNNSVNNQPARNQNQTNVIIWVLGIVFGVIILYFVVSSLFSPKTNDNGGNSNNGNNDYQTSSETIAKSKLIGEWDWGRFGYFVITNNSIYLYQDSSKSMSNVFFGTYTASNGIPTYAAGTKEGMKVITNYTSGYMDGEVYQIPTPNREYAFEPNSDGTYTITDMVSGATGTASKIK